MTGVQTCALPISQVAEDGDIRITLTRIPAQIKRGQQKYDWTASVEAIDGGVIESNDDFMYSAPETGYVSKLNIGVTAIDANWSADKKVSFFLKSRSGSNYGRVTLEFMTDSEKPKTGFSFHSVINPSGSRNLEYDPLQNMAKPPAAAKP